MTEQPPISLTITVSGVIDRGQLEIEWRELEGRAGGHSFFLSWHWIGAWLRSLPETVVPLVLRASHAGQTVGLAIFIPGITRILKIFNLPQLSLNETGHRAFDTIVTEYNGILAAKGLSDRVTQSSLEWLMRSGYPNHALRLGGVDSAVFQSASATAALFGRSLRILNQSEAECVNLAAIRAGAKPYLDSLSRNSRQTLRRELRRYETIGPLQYRPAASATQALDYFTALGHLHQSYWQSRGKPGAFAQPFFTKFHTDLIATAFDHRHIEMAKVTAGGEIIGYLYNLNWRGTIYAYQSGFFYDTENTYKPGYVSHYLAISRALDNGLDLYDFMAGYGQHKTSLSTEKNHLYWLQLRSNHFSVRVENLFRGLLNRSC